MVCIKSYGNSDQGKKVIFDMPVDVSTANTSWDREERSASCQENGPEGSTEALLNQLSWGVKGIKSSCTNDFISSHYTI